jgi:Tfp pilus assembly protein PilF
MNKLISLLIVVLVSGHVIASAANSDVSPEVERAVLAEDWKTVVQLVPDAGSNSISPTLRLIKGHACLALNRNDESLCLFLSVVSNVDMAEYQTWTTSFATHNEESAIAHYFKGDALARAQAWDDSLREFSTGLQRSPDHPLLQNARGIVFAQEGKWYSAIADFEGAIKAKPDLADAFANRGTMNLHKKAGAKGAIEWFDKALDHSKQFSLALYNQGFARVANGSADEGPKEIKDAADKLDCFSSTKNKDMTSIVRWLRKKNEAEAKEMDVADVGSQLDRIIGEVSGGNIGTLNQAARLLGKNPEFAATFNRSLDQIMRQRPELSQPIRDKVNSGFDWTRPEVGGARGWINTLQKSTVDLGLSSTTQFQQSQRQTKMSSSQQLGINAHVDFSALAQQHQLKTDMDNKGWETMRTPSLMKNTVGGVSASLAGAYVDEGDWPIDAHYGLNYEVSEPLTPNPEVKTK